MFAKNYFYKILFELTETKFLNSFLITRRNYKKIAILGKLVV